MIAWLQQHAVGTGLVLVWLLAIYSAIRAILYTRTAQGAAAWTLALLLMPVLTLPAYWIFGHTRFHGYVTRRQRRMLHADEVLAQREQLDQVLLPPEGRHEQLHTLARRLGAGGFTRGNRLQLLIDGEATFEAMLAAIAKAQDSVLIQFYIFRDDGIGRRMPVTMLAFFVGSVAVIGLPPTGGAWWCSRPTSSARPTSPTSRPGWRSSRPATRPSCPPPRGWSWSRARATRSGWRTPTRSR